MKDCFILKFFFKIYEYVYNKNSNFFNNPCWTCKKTFHSIYKGNESAIPFSMMR